MKLDWYVKRLKAMSRDEVMWRLSQKSQDKKEKDIFKKNVLGVTEGIFYPDNQDITLDPEKLSLGDVKKAVLSRYDHQSPQSPQSLQYPGLYILGGYDYSRNRKNWHGGFQTSEKWPLIYSGELNYRQRDDIGDARTNWELNRHFQFAALACYYAATGKEAYLVELGELLSDWNEKNPFLWGISWTSAMEVAIRAINWMYTLAFLAGSDGEGDDQLLEILMESLSVGIINMISYISNHFSRFSSANNHTIIEACALGMAGIMGDYAPWEELSRYLLNEELQKQNHSDGVNKEQSLHYHSFVMEGVGLLALTYLHNGRNYPQLWRNTLTAMARYLCWCGGCHGEWLVFGDDDEGKILDLSGEKDACHYTYVLELMSLILPERYVDKADNMTLMCITSGKMVTTLSKKPLYKVSPGGKVFPEGGITIFRGGDGRVLAGFDHGPLGYGSIAAHGHADALSFIVFREGKAVFGDPGTYIYHMDGESRDLFRSTKMHNTLCLWDMDQSRMLGAFLWGKRAQCSLRSQEMGADYYVEGEHNGYFPIIHRRRIAFDGTDSFIIRDRLINVGNREKGVPFEISFILPPGLLADINDGAVNINDDGITVARLQPECEEEIFIFTEAVPYSFRYGIRERGSRLVVKGDAYEDMVINTKIKIL